MAKASTSRSSGAASSSKSNSKASTTASANSKAKPPPRRASRGEANKPAAAGRGKTAKLRPASGVGAGGKGKQKKKQEKVIKAEKVQGKRKRVEEEDGEDEEPKKRRAGPTLVRSVKRVVPASVVAKSWRKLSRAAQAELRNTLEEGALEILSQLDGKARNDMQELLNQLYEVIEDYLPSLLVPPADASARAAAGQSTKGEVDIPDTDSIAEKIAAYEAALVPELAEVHALEREIKREQRLLEEDEARLMNFESARQKVETAETKESSKNMHPLLHDLLDSRAAPPPNVALFERKTPSIAWVTESAAARLPKEKEAKLESQEDEAESDEEYDPAKDDYLLALAARVGGSLAEMEKRLEGLERVARIVDEGERAIVGMM
ncbi:hypothetical protein BCR35DRAFT_324731 [Leucosporidium creatinivorum]|uniref:CENP-Q, a CENPA-CAD centromere complex subunit-domain-containing protein n=1 Tax=Leucosporidium creatinivorum TaxID=106004 RepID=A0A1Y2FKX1_9BASI|nr:hypothetical protein BCR35DRAFT_324731 [Leucosporidium creatinivorum]